MPRKTIAVALLLVSLGFTPAPVFRERPNPKDLLERLQGTWEVYTTVGPEGRHSMLARIKGDTWTYVFVTNGVESECRPAEIILGTEGDLATIDLRDRHLAPGTLPTHLTPGWAGGHKVARDVLALGQRT